MLRIDEEKVFREIESKKPRTVVFSAPDGLLAKVQEVASRVQENYGIVSLVSGDPCYGSCDNFSEHDAERLGSDLAFNVGHQIVFDRFGSKTVMIDAYDDIPFDNVLDAAVETLKQYGTTGLSTMSQYLKRLDEARLFLEKKGVKVVVGRGKGQLNNGQVFGCEFYPVFDIRDSVDVVAFLGQSPFHALGVALSTGKRTLMLDPYNVEVVDMTKLASERTKRATLSIMKAKEAEKLGIVVGMKEGQFALRRGLELKEKFEAHGKRVQMITMREITNDRLMQFPEVEAFIQTACPRIAVDGYTFHKPVLSVPQAFALLDLLDGKDLGAYFERSHWL